MIRPSVLIVADDAPLRDLQPTLERAGFQVAATRHGHEAVPLAQHAAPDVVLLGHSIPGTDALEVCRLIRRELPPDRRPIFLLAPAGDDSPSGNGSTSDRIANRLVQGIRSLLGGREPENAANRLHVHSLTIDRQRHQVLLDGRVLPLTLTEFRIIWALGLQPGYVVSRRQLTDACRGDGSQVQERTIDVHIKSIRRKLGDWSALIETVRGVGYRLQDSLVAIEPSAPQSPAGTGAR